MGTDLFSCLHSRARNTSAPIHPQLTYFSQKGGTIAQMVELVETPIPTPTDEP